MKIAIEKIRNSEGALVDLQVVTLGDIVATGNAEYPWAQKIDDKLVQAFRPDELLVIEA